MCVCAVEFQEKQQTNHDVCVYCVILGYQYNFISEKSNQTSTNI